MHFWPRLYALPGALDPQGVLRVLLVEWIGTYPDSVADTATIFRQFINHHAHRQDVLAYRGDLETDFIHFIAETSSLARTSAADVEAEFQVLQIHRQ
jgi:hypothetical protein